MIIYNSRDLFFKNPFGCVDLGQTVHFNVLSETDSERVSIVIEKDGQEKKQTEMKKSGETDSFFTYSADITFNETGLYFYHFAVGEKEVYKDQGGGMEKWQISCIDEQYSISHDFSGKVMYQIFPDRFLREGEPDISGKMTPFYVHKNIDDVPYFKLNNEGKVLNNDFFGGTLKGIEKGLDYLASLGVEIIYLNPIFMAFSNHRYDTADYMRVDPMLGTNDDFKSLCTRAHELGMKVILDGVFSHTGDDSIYFDKYNRFSSGGAYQDTNSKYKSWYSFRRYPHEYDSWWGIPTLPCVNELQPNYLEYITGTEGVIAYWLSIGADGFRLDVADELPDLFIEKLKRASSNAKADSFIIGEVWEDASNKISYGIRRKYVLGKELDGVMNYVYKNAIIDFVYHRNANRFEESIMTIAENYPTSFLLSSMVMLSTHDTDRIITCLGAKNRDNISKEQKAEYVLSTDEMKEAKKRLSVAVFLLFTLPGNSCIYYGDEAGMEGFSDPFNRKYFGLRIFDEEIFNLYKNFCTLKRSENALRYGKIDWVFSDDGFFIFKREAKDKTLYCAVNCGEKPKKISFKSNRVAYGENIFHKDGKITVLPWGCVVFE